MALAKTWRVQTTGASIHVSPLSQALMFSGQTYMACYTGSLQRPLCVPPASPYARHLLPSETAVILQHVRVRLGWLRLASSRRLLVNFFPLLRIQYSGKPNGPDLHAGIVDDLLRLEWPSFRRTFCVAFRLRLSVAPFGVVGHLLASLVDAHETANPGERCCMLLANVHIGLQDWVSDRYRVVLLRERALAPRAQTFCFRRCCSYVALRRNIWSDRHLGALVNRSTAPALRGLRRGTGRHRRS